MVPRGRERTEREEQLQRQIKGNAAQGPVVKAKKAPSDPSLDEWDGHLAAGHAGYRGWCPFCVAGKGKSEAHRRIEALRDHRHPELHLDYAFMGRETEDRVTNSGGQVLKRSLVDRTPCAVQRYSALMDHRKTCERCDHGGVQTLVRKSEQEASIVDVKNALMRALCGVEGLTVMPEESPVGASAANAVIERSVWEMQSTTRALVAYAEWVHGTVCEPGSAILTWAVEFSGQVVSRFQRSVSDGKTAYERRKLKSYRKAFVPFGELVMFMPMEKPKDKGEVRNCVGIMLGLVDRSDDVVIGTTERVVKARTVHCMPVGQRGDAACSKSIRGMPWQPNPAEAAEGEPLGMAMARIVSVPMVPIEHRTDSFSHGAEGVQSQSVPHPARSGAREVRILR